MRTDPEERNALIVSTKQKSSLCSRINHLSSCTKVAAISVVIVAVALTACLVRVNKKDASKALPSASLSLTQTSNQEDITNTTGKRTFPAPAGGDYRFSAVASDADMCSTIGRNILNAGGSVADAAIATVLCIGVQCPGSTTIGGGSVWMIYAAPRGSDHKEYIVLDSRETAPSGSTWDMYNTTSSTRGGLAVGVPGEIKGYHEAWLRFGRLGWASLFQPTIEMCKKGFAVQRDLAAKIESHYDEFKKDSEIRKQFTKTDGTKYEEGDIITWPKLAITLEQIASNPYSYYNGTLAKDILADINEEGGIMTTSDLSNYKVEWREALHTTLKNKKLKVVAAPPPFSGAVAQYVLNIIDAYNTTVNPWYHNEYTTAVHRFVEAMKFAYAKRTYLSDPSYHSVTQLVANLTSYSYADSTRNFITDDTTHNVSYYQPEFANTEDGGTSHLNVIASDGSAVSLTSTMNGNFGCWVQGKRTGIIYNNEMDDFSKPADDNLFELPPSPLNFIEPGKRPVSSMSPLFLTNLDGDITHAIGGAGGSMITTQVVDVLFRHLWFTDPLDKAIDDYRVHHQLIPNHVSYEDGFRRDIIRGLQNKGHAINEVSKLAIVNGIINNCHVPDETMEDGEACLRAVCDGRKGGAPDGV